MPRTIIGLNDPKAVKRYSVGLAADTARKSYYSRKFVGKNQANGALILRKDELESDSGDKITFDLSMRLRGAPIQGDDRAEGKQESLRFYTDEIKIDQLRKPVSAGGRMTRKRTLHNLRQVAKDRASDYWSQLQDELFSIYLSGARGNNPDFIWETDFNGFANNDVEAPDSDHILYGGNATNKASIGNDDVMNRTLIERAATRAATLNAINTDNIRVQPLKIDGEDHYVCVMSEYQAYNLRTSATTNDWADVQKAAAAAEGRSNPIFKGNMGMLNNVILHKYEGVITFGDYGADGKQPAARALFLGAGAGLVAYGSSSGRRFDWHEETVDLGNEPIIDTSSIFGVKKARFQGRDFAVIALDTYAANPN
ncbi:N4-gp56 family major capsid protein [Chitinimonas sp. BJB300]|uniref:N4-gp56 family major capsid protein n=1 Tax=Chitinimonas sp. BJB300 TaxID=1559339 RepID=UPI000C0CB91F|nr:N4-gp56 family major capsid protein [Chitinimonas sp. BJB300]PHV10184.1 N4-gp56 family major capsid protein [Chitinimonas sp. BJB300]TSJ83883.1 N4-gp56 family major capsid protein [Chitinimonas sp. BJB300]